MANHAANPADTGTVWFDDSDAEAKILAFLDGRATDGDDDDDDDRSEDGQPTTEDDVHGGGAAAEAAAAAHDGGGMAANGKSRRPVKLRRRDTSFLDLGCGNGSLLLELREDGWVGPMLGVDYSARSVALARQILATTGKQDSEDIERGGGGGGGGETHGVEDIRFEEWDLLRGEYHAPWGPLAGEQTRGWDVVLDKGTFDAVCLSSETAPPAAEVAENDRASSQQQQQRRVCEEYAARVLPTVRKGGLFIITSCNWTEEELRAWFLGCPNGNDNGQAGARFVEEGRVEYRSFSFGGVKGQTISTLCFRKE